MKIKEEQSSFITNIISSDKAGLLLVHPGIFWYRCIQSGYDNLGQCKNRWRRDSMKALNSGNVYAYIFVLMIHGYISASAPRR